MAFTRLNPSKSADRPRCAHHQLLAGLFRGLFATLLLSGPLGTARAELNDQQLNEDNIMYLGAASCASSLCHGSVQPFKDSPVLQNEFIIWQSDRYRNMHAKAFGKLLSDDAESIASKLGLGPAGEAQACLTCHADPVEKELRGPRFQLSDGVSCESCHGAAGEYIDIHTKSGYSRDALTGFGLYPSWQPEARARLCLSCHLGDEKRNINHRMMGAGHPRLSFELDTFTFLQPHHVVDEDYIERKGHVDFMRDWALGQAIAAELSLNWLMNPELGWHGIFVEPALLDCHSCHRRMNEGKWQRRTSTGLGPGEMRLNDANLVMLGMIMSAVQPDLGKQLQEGNHELHQATTRDARRVRQVAEHLKSAIQTAIDALAVHRFSAQDLTGILKQVERATASGDFQDYIKAEQAAMAMVNLVLAFERAGMVEADAMRGDLDRLFETVADEYAYRDTELLSAVRGLLRQLPE